jgi:hypothetical protein
MDIIKESLEALVKGLQYSSESDFPFAVLNWGNINEDAIQQNILANHGKPASLVKADTDTFFNHYIQRHQSGDDDIMRANALQFQKLYDYIKSVAVSTEVWRCGEIRIGIYIIIKTTDNSVLALQTTAVET